MRLDRYVSQATGASRSQARQMIRRGQVSVAGVVTKDAAAAVAETAAILCAGEALSLPRPLYLMMHKPCGLLSATEDREQVTVLSLLPAGLAARVRLVGRLDKDTSGLLLLTDDGAWSHRIASPRHIVSKTYLAELAEPLVDTAEDRLAQGVMLRSESEPTKPARLERLSATRVRLTISEGRYHQVRRMFAALGNRVLSLHRERIGDVVLDASLAAGEWRELTADERDCLA